MRFVCDSCRAQYMISDDKVGAKGVKVRCKKCGYVILVRRAEDGPKPILDEGMSTQVMDNPLLSPESGTQTVAAPSQTSETVLLKGVDDDELGAVFDSVLSGKAPIAKDKKQEKETAPAPVALGGNDDDRMSTRVLDPDVVQKLAADSGGGSIAPDDPKYDWYVAIDEKQVGPLSLDKLKELWNRGEVGPDSLCWRAGMGDWTALSEVPELAPVLAPRPSKPVIVAPAPVAAAPSAPVESAFSAGAGQKASRKEAPSMVAAGSSSVEETSTSGSWKPFAASALASLAKEEFNAINNPPPRPANGFMDEVTHAGGGLLDVPQAQEERTIVANGMQGGMPNGEMMGRPMGQMAGPGAAYGAQPPVYAPPTAQRSKVALVLVAVVGGIAVLGLVAVLIVLLSRETPGGVPAGPVAAVPVEAPRAAPPAVAEPAKPTVTAPPPAAATPNPPPAAVPAPPKAETPPAAAAPVAAAPEPAKPAPAPVAAADPARSSRDRDSASSASRNRAASNRVATREGERESESAQRPARTPPPAPAAEESGGEDFESVFGGEKTARKSVPKGAQPEQRKRNESNVYVPPAPGGGPGSDIPESLAQSDIFQVVLSNRGQLDKCASEQRKRDPGVTGKLIVQWTIQTNGRTKQVMVAPESEDLKASYFASCVGGLVKSWVFPRHQVQGDVVKFPFKF